MAITAAQLDVRFTSSGSDRVKSDLKGVGDTVESANSGFARFQNAMLGFGTAMLPVLGAGITFSANMEQAMADVNASLGGVDTSVLKELEQGFIDIGAASQFSAVEVAAVGDELARAGYPTNDIVAMTQAVVDLTQATGAGLMVSVDGITSAMALWNAEVVDASIALTDAGRAADIFTVAANASKAEVSDIIAGVRNLGPMAAAIGIGFDETAAAIAFFTTNGMKAADAGVSTTRAIQNLLDPTAEAQELMTELGISAFDMEGNFVGLPVLFDQLQTAMADMTPEMRAAALSTIFGAEALDAMMIAAANGGDPMRVIMELMGETGVAAEQSAMRMDTLKAQFGELVESAISFTGQLVSGLMPGLRGVVDLANSAVNAFSRLPQPVLSAIGAIGAVAAAFATLKGAAAGLAIIERLTGVAVPGGRLLSGLATPLLAISAAAGIAYLAIRTNFLGIGDAVETVMDHLDMLGEHFRYFHRMGLDPVNAALVAVGHVFPDLADEMQTAQRIVNDLTASFRQFRDQGAGPVGAALLAIGATFPEIMPAMEGLSRVTRGLGDAFQAAVRGDWADAFDGLRMAAQGAWDAIGEIAGGVVNLGEWWVDVGRPTVTGWLAGGASAIQTWIQEQMVGVRARLDQWTLDLAGPDGRISSAEVIGWIDDQLEGIAGVDIELQDWTLKLNNPEGDLTVADIVTWIDEQLEGIAGVDIELQDWTLKLNNPEGDLTVADIVSWIDDQLEGMAGVDIELQNWTLKLNNPEGDLTVADIVSWIDDELESLIGVDIELQDWKLKLGKPSIDLGVTELIGWIDDYLESKVGIDIELQNWNLKLDNPFKDDKPEAAPETTGAAPPGAVGSFFDPLEGGAQRVQSAVRLATQSIIDFGTAAATSASQTSQAGTALETVGGELKTIVQIIQNQDPFAGTVLSAQNAITAISTLGTTMATAIPPVTLTVTADTSAAVTSLGETAGAMAAIDGTSSTVQVLGDNAGALAAVATAAGALGGIDGRTAQTFVAGDPSGAIGAVGSAMGALASVDGFVATAYIEAVNNVGGAVGAAAAALMSIDGMTATTYINVVSTGGAGIGGAIPGRAGGGVVREPLTLVGEFGPELVSLPYGSYVHTAAETRAMMAEGIAPPAERRNLREQSTAQVGGDTYELHIHGNVYGVDELADSLEAAISRRRRGYGQAVAS